MSQINENEIHNRLNRLSQVEPGQEATERAIRKARQTLMSEQAIPRHRSRLPLFIIKLAAAAVLMVGAGFIGGRLSAPEPLDVRELQAALESSMKSSFEPALRQEILAEIDNHLQLALATESNKLKEDLARQVHRDMDTYVEQTLTVVGNLMDQRLMNFARMIEAARIKDRQHVAAAFDYMGSRFGDGLVTLATRTDNLLDSERADSSQDVSEN